MSVNPSGAPRGHRDTERLHVRLLFVATSGGSLMSVLGGLRSTQVVVFQASVNRGSLEVMASINVSNATLLETYLFGPHIQDIFISQLLYYTKIHILKCCNFCSILIRCLLV